MARVAWLVPVVLAAALYAGALRGELVWDDQTVQQEQIVAFQSLRDVFFTPRGIHEWAYAYYRPLVTLSYVIDQRLFGRGATVGPHATGVVTHVLVTLLVWLLARRVLRPMPHGDAGALVAAVVFAAHPIHTESVCWVTGRSDPLAALFMVPSVALALHYRDSGRGWALAAAPLLFLLAVFAKEVALSTLLVVPLLLALLPSPRRGRVLPLAAGYGLATAAYLGLRQLDGGGYGAASRDLAGSLGELPRALAWYARKVLVPYPQSHFVGELPDVVATAVALTVLAGIVVLGWWLQRRGAPILLIASGWFVLTLLPSLGVVVRGLTDTPVAERYLYIPSIGLCLAVGGALAAARGTWRVPATVATGALVVAYGYATIERGRVWQSDLALWTDATEKVPDSGLAWLNRGMVFMGRHDSETAIENFQRALASRGNAENRSLAHNNIGMARVRQGRLDDAEAEFRAALRERARYETPYYGLGLVTLMREQQRGMRDARQLEVARGFFAQALTIAPQYVWALARLAECDMQLASLYAGNGDQARARAALLSARGALGRVARLDPAFKLGERTTRDLVATIDATLARLAP